MSEQKQSGFMQELDAWIDANVVHPLVEADRYEPVGSATSELMLAVDVVKRAIRQKVLESYRNGQQAGPRKGGRYGR